MRVKAYRSIGDPSPAVIDASFVLIEKEDGTPLAVAAMLDPAGRFYSVAHAGEPTFNRTLHTLGVEQLVFQEFAGQVMKPASQLSRII